METLTVRHTTGDRFTIDVRGHRIVVDQPTDLGGDDSAPTPTELFVAGLVSCIAFFARRFLARHDLPEDVEVTGSYALGGRPARVETMRIAIRVSDAVPPERHSGLLAVASRCTVHNTLEQPPQVDITLFGAEVGAETGAGPQQR